MGGKLAGIRHALILFSLLGFGLAGGCLEAPKLLREERLSALEEKGRMVFMREPCTSCHVLPIALANLEVSRGVAPNLRKTPRRSPDWYLAYFVDSRAVLPWSPMPSYGYLPDDEVEALIAFLQRLNKEASTAKAVTTEKTPEFPRNLNAYNAGRRLYGTYCAGCHGELGNGAGRAGHLLSPEPRDFTDAVWLSKQTESYLFSVVADGKPNTAMPGFRDILRPRERALVVNYIQYFADPVAKERMELGELRSLN